jgi:hypothetical protein
VGIAAGIALVFVAVAILKGLPVFGRIDPDTNATHLTLGEDGVTARMAGKTTRWKWTAFESFAETPNLLVLRFSVDSGRIIPKRAFASEARLAAARELATRQLLPPAQPPPLPSDALPPWGLP